MNNILIWEAMCLTLLYLVFCRSVMVDTTTTLDTRIALWAAGLASLVGIGAPIYGWEPDVVTLSLLVSALIVQITMAYRWRFGVPDQFVKGKFRRVRRRVGDHV